MSILFKEIAQRDYYTRIFAITGGISLLAQATLLQIAPLPPRRSHWVLKSLGMNTQNFFVKETFPTRPRPFPDLIWT